MCKTVLDSSFIELTQLLQCVALLYTYIFFQSELPGHLNEVRHLVHHDLSSSTLAELKELLQHKAEETRLLHSGYQQEKVWRIR